MITYNDVLNSPGMQYLNRMKIYSFSYHCFEMNMLELMQSLELLNDADVAANVWKIENRKKRDIVFREILRRFHNAVAASKSLIEHTRIFVDENYGKVDVVFSAYRVRVAEVFATNGNAALVEDLRNYFLHAGIPPIKMHMILSPGCEVQHRVFLGLEELKSWGRWKSRSRIYLHSVNDDIDLLSLISEYHASVVKFHSWFASLLDDHHKNDIDEMMKLDKKFRVENGVGDER